MASSHGDNGHMERRTEPKQKNVRQGFAKRITLWLGPCGPEDATGRLKNLAFTCSDLCELCRSHSCLRCVPIAWRPALKVNCLFACRWEHPRTVLIWCRVGAVRRWGEPSAFAARHSAASARRRQARRYGKKVHAEPMPRRDVVEMAAGLRKLRG
jgi:hypothetical protein